MFTSKKEKSVKVQEIQKFLKKSINWRPPKNQLLPLEDLNRLYDGEKYMVLGSRNEKNPDTMETIIFTNDQAGYKAILKWNPDYKQLVFDLSDFGLVKENNKKMSPTLEDICNEATIRKNADSTSD